jgi:glycosyltransferase involved in cell wall biosynthesis
VIERSVAMTTIAKSRTAPAGRAPDSARGRILFTFTVSQSLIFVAGLARYLRTRGWDVGIASAGGPELERMGAEGFPTFVVPFTRTSGADLAALRRLRSVLRAFRPDIVHASTPKAGTLTMLTSVGLPARRIYTMRGLPLETATGPARALMWLAEFVSCTLAHRALCVSQSLRYRALELRIASARKLTVLGRGSGQGVDCDRFDPDRATDATRVAIRGRLGIPDDAFVFGFVGRFARDKGIRELHAAWAQQVEQDVTSHLVLVGRSDERQDVSAVMAGLQALPRVHIQPHSTDMPGLYCSFDAVVLPTYREGLSNVLLEAGAMGLPAVSAAVTGCTDVVADGETGRLVPARDPNGLAVAMQQYAGDPELARRHGAAARERVIRDFRQEHVWRMIESIYVRQMDMAPRAGRRFRSLPQYEAD